MEILFVTDVLAAGTDVLAVGIETLTTAVLALALAALADEAGLVTQSLMAGPEDSADPPTVDSIASEALPLLASKLAIFSFKDLFSAQNLSLKSSAHLRE